MEHVMMSSNQRSSHDMHFIQHGATAKIKKGDQFLLK